MVSTPRIAALRRYPVKAMGGESLDAAEIDARGLVGDRSWAVHDTEHRLAACKNSRRFRRHDTVTSYTATLGPDPVPTVTHADGEWAVGDPELTEHLTTTMGEPVRVLPESDMAHHDAGQVSLVGTATLAWCTERLGVDADPRRLRVNVVVETEHPFEEETWVGQEIALGTARLRVVRRIERCRVIDLAQDGVASGTRWLKPLTTERDMQVAVYADVVTAGRIRVGDPATPRVPSR